MSKYTTQLRFFVEMNSKDNQTFEQRIEESLPKLFDFKYPIFDEMHRQVLEKKIVKKYFFKEIGVETFEMFKFYLNERLNAIMPYYNEFYKISENKFDYLIDVDTTENYDNNKNQKGKQVGLNTGETSDTSNQNQINVGEGKTTGTGTNNSKNLNSDLPQINFSGVDYGTDYQEKEDKTTSSSTDNTTSSLTADIENIGSTILNSNIDTEGDSKEEYIRKMKGLNGARSQTQLMEEYRNSLINIDEIIVNALADLFITIY